MSIESEHMSGGPASPGFVLVESEELPSLSSAGSWHRHPSGLEALCIQNGDRENLFALGFRTLPEDGCGTPHILEHAVLCGSREYPLRDPFIALVQSSLATFLNAMTYGDRTLFPVCSCNHRDLRNLARVYWDAVFHPLLRKESFLQEGWRHELRKGRGGRPELIRNGIVLNEMKGAYADLDTVCERAVRRHLLPDTPLALDSGGDPEHIPELAYERFLDYHRRHYTLANARVLLYGDLPEDEKLDLLAELLRNEPIPPVPAAVPEPCPVQTPWERPRRARERFPSDPAGSGPAGAAFALAWDLGPIDDPVEGLAVELLDFLLFGSDGAVMNRTLLESGLCKALLACGCDDDYQETIFQIGVRGIDPRDFPRLERLALATLEGLCRDGIPETDGRSAFRQLQRDQSEIDADHCLEVMEDVFAAWSQGRRNPFVLLRRDRHFRELAARLRTIPGYLEGLLRRMLLENPHRLALELLPDGGLLEEREETQRRTLAEALQAMPEEERRRIRRETRDLRAWQSRPEPPEDLRKLPRLRRRDLAPRAGRPPVEEIVLDGGFALQNGRIFTNGVDYLNLGFDLAGFPPELHPDLPLFLWLFHRVGTDELDYDQAAGRMAGQAMSLRLAADSGYAAGPRKAPRGLLVLSARTLSRCLPRALEILEGQWLRKSFREEKRIGELLRQRWSQMHDEIPQCGQCLASFRASLGQTPFAVFNDGLHGALHVKRCHDLSGLGGDDLAALRGRLAAIARWFAAQRPFGASFSGEDSDLPRIAAWLGPRAAAGSRELGSPAFPPPLDLPAYRRRELLPLNSGGACCARIHSAPGIDSPLAAGMAVFAQLLGCGCLWERIRMQGGAYGVNCQYQPFSGLLGFLTSEDPRPLQSFGIFTAILDTDFRSVWTDRDLESAVVACSKGDDRPWRPAQVTAAALLDQAYGYTEDMRQRRRDLLLGLGMDGLLHAIDEFKRLYGDRYNDCLAGPGRWARNSGLATIPLF